MAIATSIASYIYTNLTCQLLNGRTGHEQSAILVSTRVRSQMRGLKQWRRKRRKKKKRKNPGTMRHLRSLSRCVSVSLSVGSSFSISGTSPSANIACRALKPAFFFSNPAIWIPSPLKKKQDHASKVALWLGGRRIARAFDFGQTEFWRGPEKKLGQEGSSRTTFFFSSLVCCVVVCWCVVGRRRPAAGRPLGIRKTQNRKPLG